jgi:hypothetical protein
MQEVEWYKKSVLHIRKVLNLKAQTERIKTIFLDGQGVGALE